MENSSDFFFDLTPYINKAYNSALDKAAQICYNYKDRVKYDINDPSKPSNFEDCASEILQLKKKL